MYTVIQNDIPFSPQNWNNPIRMPDKGQNDKKIRTWPEHEMENLHKYHNSSKCSSFHVQNSRYFFNG